MIGFSKYLRHRLKSTFMLTVILCVLAVLFVHYSTYLHIGHYHTWDSVTGESTEHERLYISGFNCFVIILGIMATILPVLELSGTKNKRNADLLYSLPVSRTGIALAYYLSGLIQMLAIHTCAYAAMYVKVVTSPLYSWVEYPSALIWCYFVTFVAGAALYSIFMAIFNSANTVLDGCAFIGVWSILPPLFAMALSEFDASCSGELPFDFIDRIRENFLFPHESLGISEYFYSIITGRGYSEITTDSMPTMQDLGNPILIAGTVFWIGIGIACAAVYFYSFRKKRAEELGNLSETPFGYKVIVPISVFSMTQAFDNILLSLIFAAILGVIGYMIYRRSLKIKRSDIITTAAITVISGLFLAVLQ